jgi:predicted membrane-bound mannosyltransferase
MRPALRVGAFCAATAIAATGLALPLAQSASAALKASVVCSKIAATTTLNTAKGTGTTATTWSRCTPTALSAGGTSSVTVPISKLTGNLTSKITWKNSKGTTTVTMKYTTQKTKTGCPTGTAYRTIITGTTKASTGAAKNIVKVGEPINAEVCTKTASQTKYVSTLKPGTKFKI